MKSFKDVIVVALAFLLLFTPFPVEAACGGGQSTTRIRVKFFGRFRQRATLHVRSVQCAAPVATCATITYAVPATVTYPALQAPAKTLPIPTAPAKVTPVPQVPETAPIPSPPDTTPILPPGTNTIEVQPPGPQASLNTQAALAVMVTGTVPVDPYGFTQWLNTTRATYGLTAVTYDANLAAWANANNGQQQSRGMGHHVMGAARRQNAAMGNYASIGRMWMASADHRSALLDPTIRRVGIAGLGMYWTFNAN